MVMNGKDLLERIFADASKNDYSDIHLNTGNRPMVRNRSGEIIFLDESYVTLSQEIITELITIIAGKIRFEKFKIDMELDISYQFSNGNRYRVNCYVDTKGYSLAIRLIPEKIPNLAELGLGEQIKEMCNKSKGLILITGPTGSGKSTNLAAMIDYINTYHKKHIITIEDPVEFSFQSKQSLINQREIGNHTKSFSAGTKSLLREDPDVVVIGEMRDADTIRTALTLAETGHLVFSTLHTNDAVQTIDRIIDTFPGNQHAQIRMQLSQSLIGVVCQRLLPRIDRDGKVPAREVMLCNHAVKNLILSGKTHQIYSVLEVGKKSGMILMDHYLIALYKKGVISKDILKSLSRDKESIDMMME